MTLKTVEKWSKHETDREREGENIERNIMRKKEIEGKEKINK